MKGIVHPDDAERVVSIGVDGVIVSNHGGRQIDVGRAAIASLQDVVRAVGHRTTVMMDSGLRSGADVAVALARGARLGLLGRAPMYAVAALGERGGDHVLTMLTRQLRQVLEQLGCPHPARLPDHLS